MIRALPSGWQQVGLSTDAVLQTATGPGDQVSVFGLSLLVPCRRWPATIMAVQGAGSGRLAGLPPICPCDTAWAPLNARLARKMGATVEIVALR